MSRTYDDQPVIEQIAEGEHDAVLWELIRAARSRQRALAPIEELRYLAELHQRVLDLADEADCNKRTAAAAEVNTRLKKLLDQPNPHIKALAMDLRRRVFIEGLGMDPGKYDEMEVKT